MLQRPVKPASGIKELNFKFDQTNLDGFKELISLLSHQKWQEWNYRQKQLGVHTSTQTVRLMWLDLFITSYKHSDSIKFDLLDEAAKFLGNLFLYLENYYKGSVCRIILTKQEPHSIIPIHTDKGFSLTHTHRIHIPFFTNENVLFYCGTDTLNMEVGMVYEINNQLGHKVINCSDDYKIHLIIDVIENSYIEKEVFDTDPLFIHIPKTAGTSVTSILKQNGYDNWTRNPLYKNHDPLFLLEENNNFNKNTFVFSVVRNPFTRAYSYYHHFKRINYLNITFMEFLKFVRNRIPFYDKTPLITYNQSFYLFNNKGLLKIQKLYKFENLQELEYDFNVFLNRLNVGEYSLEQYYLDYSQDAQNLVRHLYHEDFINCNYSMEFV